MLKHIVMWSFIDGAADKSRAEHAAWMKEHLEALVGVVPEIRSLEVGINQSTSPMAYDAVMTLVVDDAEALKRYRQHPEHIKISEYCQAVRQARVVVDYVIS